ncbi:dTMP kinase [Halosimplex pelagicum]|uniref:Probable thymidylate kinase n=1 Tax=Halosimplex pelagicum TaxID=869886 RepID=A0A7D5TAS6_9EURY|nr:dTMP kinase [Halosimplex pelagicum]QLH81569.1 dTMP kinase [Halosimplex pelagicum]
MLVTLEGLDGSGKSSAAAHLAESDALPDDAAFTREPTESWYGEAVARSIGDADADSLAELFLYTADHADHLDRVVRPALAEGRLVVSDRYSDSRYAYQGATLDAHPHLDVDDPLDYVRDVHRPFTRRPDATVYLDVDPETGARRAGSTNKMEQVEFLESVRANYERLIDGDPERFVRIDATRPQEAVLSDVESAVLDLLDG